MLHNNNNSNNNNNNNNNFVVSIWLIKISKTSVCAAVQKRNKNNQQTFFSWTSKKSFSTIRSPSLCYITISPSKCRAEVWKWMMFSANNLLTSPSKKRDPSPPFSLSLHSYLSFYLSKWNKNYKFWLFVDPSLGSCKICCQYFRF